MITKVHLHGLPRSGTNYLEYLLKENFKVPVQSGSKHGIMRVPDTPDRRIIFITKHPLDWLISYYDYGIKTESLFEDKVKWEKFLTTPLVIKTGPKGMWFRYPIYYWNCHNNHYTKWQNARHVRHMDLNIKYLQALSEDWHMPRHPKRWVNTPMNMGTNAQPMSGRYRPKGRDRYTQETMKIVMDQVEWGLMRRLGYA